MRLPTKRKKNKAKEKKRGRISKEQETSEKRAKQNKCREKKIKISSIPYWISFCKGTWDKMKEVNCKREKKGKRKED